MQKPGFKLAGFSVRTTNQDNKAMQDTGMLWGRVMKENLLEQIPNRVGTEIIAVYYDYEGDYTQPYTCLIGVPVSSDENLPEGATSITIPTQTYKTFTAKGKMPDALIATWQKIWQTPLDRNYRFDFEVYDEKSCGEHPEVTVWIGVNK